MIVFSLQICQSCDNIFINVKICSKTAKWNGIRPSGTKPPCAGMIAAAAIGGFLREGIGNQAPASRNTFRRFIKRRETLGDVMSAEGTCFMSPFGGIFYFLRGALR